LPEVFDPSLSYKWGKQAKYKKYHKKVHGYIFWAKW
jgi:hypothetical protein